MEKGILSTLALGAALGGLYQNPFGEAGFRRGKVRKQRWGIRNQESRAKKASNRRNNKLARSNRRLNLRRGKVAGSQ